jgi:outer membrane protein OmpA-like peptidoglycan-associated protein
MTEVQQRLGEVKKGQAIEQERINKIGSISIQKLAEIKLDSIINNRIQARLLKAKTGLDSVNAIIETISQLLVSKKDFRKNYRPVILPVLLQLEQYRNLYNIRQQAYLMLEDGLDITTYTLFDLAAFFGSGKYRIPEEATELASKSFAPLVDSVIQFSNKYKNLPRKASLVILGFADGTGFDVGSDLYNTLANLIGNPNPTNPELNQKLSELRAAELVKMLYRQFVIRNNTMENKDIFSIEYLEQGKGEQYPIPTIKDYRVNDERRRIVLCYWAVIPD